MIAPIAFNSIPGSFVQTKLLGWQPLDQLRNKKSNEVQKYPPTYKTWDSPKYPFRYPLEY